MVIGQGGPIIENRYAKIELHSKWRDRLRFEYLQEKLGKTNAKKKPSKEAIKTAPKTSAEEIADTLIRRYRRERGRP